MSAEEGSVTDGWLETRSAMTDDPKLEGLVVLILDRLSLALRHARDYGNEVFPEDADFVEAVPRLWSHAASKSRCLPVVRNEQTRAEIPPAPPAHRALGIWHLSVWRYDVLVTIAE